MVLCLFAHTLSLIYAHVACSILEIALLSLKELLHVTRFHIPCQIKEMAC